MHPSPLRGLEASHLGAGLLTATLTALAPAPALATTAGAVAEISAPMGAGQRAPAISWEPDPNLPGGGIYLMVWEDDRDRAMFGTDLYVLRVRPDGTEVAADSGGVSFLEASVRGGDQVGADIVYAGSASPPVHLIVWTDPRNGIQDIFGTRFLSSTMTAIPSAGFQITSSAMDTDAFPAVAFSGGNYLTAFQTNVSGGAVEVNGQRIFSDTTLDGSPVTLSGTGRGLNPDIIAEGGRFVFAYETPLGGSRIGAVPDTGAIGTVSSSTLSTSTSAQSLIQLATVGQDIIAVWQDARNADRDIYGARIDPATLMTRGPDFAVAATRNNQLAPAIAGDSSGGLVVWQDRRNTSSNAQIFGARLDGATGAVVDEDGFPLFTFNANAFEPSVAKGPGDDYLVAAIRFGQPSRLFFRVVRDEVPAGTLTAQGRTVVPADGVSTATVGFATAQGASGFTVVDGTLYDVTLSSSSPSIVEPDADPSRSGHQAGAVAGVVQVSLQSAAREMVTVSVASVEGTSTGSAMVDFQNVAPVATDIRISPAMPRSVDDLSLSYTFFDVNGDTESNTEIVWLKNDGTQPMFGNQTTVPSSATARGERWRAWVRPGDGIERNPSRAFSSTVTIGNTAPEIVSASLSRDMMPMVPPQTNTRIVLRYRFTDVDLDNERGSRIRWFDRGSPVPALDQETAIPPAMVIKGQVWRVEITPNDGFEEGPTVSTSTLTVVNTAPVAIVGPEVRVDERRAVMLDGTMSSDVDPQDTLTYTWTQIRGEPVTLDDPSSATPSFTAPSIPFDANLQFSLEVSDGEASVTSQTAQVVDVTALPDADNDGLDDEEEMMLGTDPMRRDTDRDGIEDLQEVEWMLDPLDSDTDDDGLRDGREGQACRNDCPADPLGDADMDGVVNARDPDSDDDGLPDGLELGEAEPLAPGTGPFPYAGTDVAAGFFVADVDVGTTTDPTLADTDSDTLSDGTEDANANGRVDEGESDPNDPLDPGISCTGDGMCPGNLVCVDGVCSESSTMMCDPLPERFECCAGACIAASSTVDPVCVAGASRERCSVDTTQCLAGTCLGMAPPAPSDGCSCAAPRRGDAPTAWAGFALLAGLAFVRRRQGSPAAQRSSARTVR